MIIEVTTTLLLLLLRLLLPLLLLLLRSLLLLPPLQLLLFNDIAWQMKQFTLKQIVSYLVKVASHDENDMYVNFALPRVIQRRGPIRRVAETPLQRFPFGLQCFIFWLHSPFHELVDASLAIVQSTLIN